MTSYTTISSLPYPVMSDPPNGPDQMRQLALTLEAKLVNRYKDAATRNARVTNPALGMLTFRDDVKQYEYWDGSSWVGATQNLAVASTNRVTSATNKSFTTSESAALVKSSVKLVNPSNLYRMLYTCHSLFQANITNSTGGLFSVVKYYTQVDSNSSTWRDWGNYSMSGSTVLRISGSMPVQTGYVAPGGSVTLTSWLTIEKGNSASGNQTLTFSSTELTITGMTTV